MARVLRLVAALRLRLVAPASAPSGAQVCASSAPSGRAAIGISSCRAQLAQAKAKLVGYTNAKPSIPATSDIRPDFIRKSRTSPVSPARPGEGHLDCRLAQSIAWKYNRRGQRIN